MKTWITERDGVYVIETQHDESEPFVDPWYKEYKTERGAMALVASRHLTMDLQLGPLPASLRQQTQQERADSAMRKMEARRLSGSTEPCFHPSVRAILIEAEAKRARLEGREIHPEGRVFN